MTHQTVILTGCVMFLGVIGAGAAQDERPPWKLSAREHAEKRAIAAATHCQGDCREAIAIDGKRNPELLMPSELMDTLAGAYTGSDLSRRAAVRELWQSRDADLVRLPRFWDRLYDAGRPFFDAWAAYFAVNASIAAAPAEERERLENQRNDIFSSICPLRADALAAAHREFGPEMFNRFLYTAIAPGLLVHESCGYRMQWQRRHLNGHPTCDLDREGPMAHVRRSKQQRVHEDTHASAQSRRPGSRSRRIRLRVDLARGRALRVFDAIHRKRDLLRRAGRYRIRERERFSIRDDAETVL